MNKRNGALCQTLNQIAWKGTLRLYLNEKIKQHTYKKIVMSSPHVPGFFGFNLKLFNQEETMANIRQNL